MKALSKLSALASVMFGVMLFSCSTMEEPAINTGADTSLTRADESGITGVGDYVGIPVLYSITNPSAHVTEYWEISGVPVRILSQGSYEIAVIPESAGTMRITAICFQKGSSERVKLTKQVEVKELPWIRGLTTVNPNVVAVYSVPIDDFFVESWDVSGVLYELKSSDYTSIQVIPKNTGMMTISANLIHHRSSTRAVVTTTVTVQEAGVIGGPGPEIRGVITANVGIPNVFAIASDYKVSQWTVSGVSYTINNQDENSISLTPRSTGTMIIDARCYPATAPSQTYTVRKNVTVY